MPDYRRAHVPGGTYLFTVNTYRRQTFLTDSDVRYALREAIGTLRLTHPFVIEALLPDHMHGRGLRGAVAQWRPRLNHRNRSIGERGWPGGSRT